MSSSFRGKYILRRDYYAPRNSKRTCRSIDRKNLRFLSGTQPYDEYERRSLRQQAREISQMRTAPYTGYTRGPEILRAIQKLKSETQLS